MMYRFVLLGCLLLAGACGRAQTTARTNALQNAELTLDSLSYQMYTDSSEEARFTACRSLIKELVNTLKLENSFDYPFGGVRGLQVLYADDRSFRIFSWELHVHRDEYRHYGAVQLPGKDLKLFPLIDRGDQLRENPELAALTPDNWLGYAAFKLMPGGQHEGRPYWFVFGYDSYGAFRRQKVLDVLSFNENGQPVFGLPVFDSYTEKGQLIEGRRRLVLQYGAEGTVAFRYDEDLDAIVYENLILMPGPRGEGPVNMPDGSYHALLRSDGGRWSEDPKLFRENPVIDDAPRRAKDGKSIIGKN